MDPVTQLTEHLKFLSELGVDGLSRDPSWRSASGERPAEPASLPATEAAPAAASVPARHVAAPVPADLAAIRTDLGDCTRCKLHGLGRRQIVFGVGNPDADLMFIGEAPGRDEDTQGIPFVGRAGQLLTKMIEAMGYTREQVYIANVIKCRPPENRNPDPDEVQACEPFLFRQVESIRPKVIVALGTFAAQALLRTQESISRLRGRVYTYGGAKLIPTFHPAYLLRSPDRKRDTWDDLKRAIALLQETE
jgi:DNA polymerase